MSKIYNITCLICSNNFNSNHPNKKYCSINCKDIGLIEYKKNYYLNNKNIINSNCLHCNDDYVKNRTNQKYCSSKCMKTASAYRLAPKRKVINCLICNNSLENMSKLAKFCSKKCSSKYERINKPDLVLKRQQTPKMKISQSIRKRLCKLIRKENKLKTSDVVGCSWDFLVIYLENQFVDGMTWDNYGIKGWHIDHIKPLSSFDLNCLKQQKLANHYSNLQPLWAADNLKKGNSFSLSIEET